MKNRRLSILIIGAIISLAALLLFSGLMISDALFRTKLEVGGNVDYTPPAPETYNVTFVVDGAPQSPVAVPIGQPIGNYFPEGKDETQTCGYYRNSNFTDLVEASDTTLTEDITLYTATRTPNLTLGSLSGGGIFSIGIIKR